MKLSDHSGPEKPSCGDTVRMQAVFDQLSCPELLIAELREGVDLLPDVHNLMCVFMCF